MSSAFDANSKSVIDIKGAKIWQYDKQVLNDVDIQLNQAEFVYLIGKSGSGKTTLIKSLYGAFPIEAKKAIVAGYDLINITKKEMPFYRRKLGIVFQEFHLFPEWTLHRNLEFVLQATGWNEKAKINQRIEEVLTDVKMLAYINTKVYELSGGEQQKLSIARSMLNKPVLLVADEPTGNLDPESSNDILQLLHKISINYKTTILFATHDVEIMKKFPARVLECAEGQLRELVAY